MTNEYVVSSGGRDTRTVITFTGEKEVRDTQRLSRNFGNLKKVTNKRN